jgi:TolB-like protein
MTGNERSALGARHRGSLLHRLRERGVLRVAASYAIIAWLALQIASVVFEPLGVPKWVMTALIIAAAAGFPIAIALAWFLELGEQGITVDTAPEGAPRPRTRGLRHYADVVVIGVLLIAVVVLLVRQSDIGKPNPPENPAIAVMPFENQSGDPGQEYFSDGLADEMLERLGRVPGLRVTARSSSFSFKDANLDAKTIAEKLGVTTLLEGSVRRDGRRLKLSARLIDGATGQQTWSGSFDREMNDVFDVQAELARAVVDAIIPAAKGAVASDSAPPTTDLSAYDLYLLARAQFVLRTAKTFEKASNLAEQAVRLDPSFAQAHALLGNSLLLQTIYLESGVPPEQTAELVRRAEASIHRALSLDPNLSEAHQAYGVLLRTTRRPGAEEEFKRAIELNPSNAYAWHDYAVYLGGDPQREADSLHATRRALELDPHLPATWANYLDYIRGEGRKRFEQELDRAIRAIGDMPFALDRILMPWAAYAGYPVAVMQAGVLKMQARSDDNLPLWLNFVRAWATVDPVRALQIMPDHVDPHHGVAYESIRLFLHAELTGLEGDWTQLDRDIDGLRARFGADDPTLRSLMTFWYAVQGRYDEAAQSLPLAASGWMEGRPPMLGDNIPEIGGLRDAARLRIYRGTGRTREADQLARELLTRFRVERRAAGNGCRWDGWLPYASIAAMEGHRDEAVDALKGAMHCGDLPYGFQPAFPWFKSLEGYAPYDALVRERARRVEEIRPSLLKLEADHHVTPADLARIDASISTAWP